MSLVNNETETIANHRADIDGLRAVAVLPVLLFHAQLGCPGGFVGVDVFFVISGFLIASLIRREILTGSFSLAGFWERRIRRILPALLLVVLASFVAGWFLYLPEDFAALGRSCMAQATLLSNYHFYTQAGYFEAGSDTKPLLHTWSLAVEEQFYVGFPLLLAYLSRSKRFSVSRGIGALTLGSLALSVVGSYKFPSATFYLLPARCWELLLGAWLATMSGRLPANRLTRESAGWGGLVLVCLPVFLYDADTRFPGWAAVPPCLGAALIIFSSESRLSLVGRILSFKPTVFVGLISYSLYLWHWPLIVFATYPTGYLAWESRAALLVVSFMLAVLSWRYVETPFRRRGLFNKRSQVLAMGVTSLLLTFLLGYATVHFRGIPERIPAAIREETLAFADSRHHQYTVPKITLEQAKAGEFVELGDRDKKEPISVLIWGDSHAKALAPVFDELCKRRAQRGVLAFYSGTAPVLGYISTATYSLREDSSKFNSAVLDFISKQHVKNVVLAARWSNYAGASSFDKGLQATIRSILENGAKAYLVKDVPKHAFDVPRFTAFSAMHGGNLEQLGVTVEAHQALNRSSEKAFNQVAQFGAILLDPAAFFINRRGLYGVVKDHQVLYADNNHLTVEGSRILAPLFEPILESRQ